MDRFGWDFDAVRKNARDTWNHLLKKIEIEGGSDAERTKFYTNLYRSFVARTIFSDVNGKYVDPTGRVQQLKDPALPMLGCDAFWNTFWNLNELWGLVTPGILNEWATSELELNDKGGWLARGPAGLRYSGIMVAEHEIAILVSAWQKGIRNFDGEKAFAAIKHVQTAPGMIYYKDLNAGWVGMRTTRALSRPRLRAGGRRAGFADARIRLRRLVRSANGKGARQAGRLPILFSTRENYRRVWDPSVGYFRPKHRDGRWLADFSPFDQKHYTEGTAWQYSFWVPQDVKGLIGLMGRDELVRRLNQGFEDSRPDFASDTKYVNVGNQPNMEAPLAVRLCGRAVADAEMDARGREALLRHGPRRLRGRRGPGPNGFLFRDDGHGTV